MILLQIVCTLSLAAAAFGCLYQVLLALVALLPRVAGPSSPHAPDASSVSDAPDTTFAIVIPAHNEEAVIADTLRSCAAIDYPADKKTVYVVADNCDDRTAEIAQTAGATCLVRTDTRQRGKGQTLRWAFDRILPEGPDAVVVLDADSALESGSLKAFDKHLRSGGVVLQANNCVANPDDNATSYVLAVASTIENDLFYAPKDRLGMAVLLQGTGMVLSRQILIDHPWQAQSIVEDTQYSLRLMDEGIPIRFLRDVRVTSPFPTRDDQLAVQRSRWVGGGVRLGKSHALKLIADGFRRRRPVLVDAGVTMLLASRPLILLHLLLTLGLSLLCIWLAPGPWSLGLLLILAGVVGVYAAYVAVGVVMLGPTVKRIRLAFGAPFAVLRYLQIAVTALFGAAPSWQRTPRIKS